MTYWDNLKQTLTNLVDTYHRKKSIQELHSLTERCPIIQPDKAVIRAYKYRGHGQYKRISPYQNPSELIELTKIVRDKQPKTVVEIGTDRGGTLYVWTQALPTANRFISIDLPGGDFGGGYSEGRAQFYKSFTDKDLTCIRQNSHHEETKQQLKENLQDHSIDFLFIDADHTYEGVKQDHKMYKDLVSDNGIIAFHDIVPNDTAPAIGVDTYWEELKENHTTKEIIADPDQGGGGIGIIEHKNQKQ
jgi:cephalosporin hydroxylase